MNKPKPFKSLRTAHTQKTFNLKYPKTSILRLTFSKALLHRQKIDINLKRALSKKLVCQKLSIIFQDWTSLSQIQNHLVILAKSLARSPNIKSLNLKLELNYSLHNVCRGFIESFVPKLRKLNSLQIYHSSYSKNFTINNLIKNVRKLPQLRHLALNFSYLGSIAEEHFKKALKSLSPLKNKLESFFLNSSDYLSVETWSLFSSTLSQFTSLRYLNLQLRDPNLSAETVEILTYHLKQLESLTNLSINIAGCRYKSFLRLKEIIEMSYHLPKLTSFSFFFREPQYFSDDDFLELAHNLIGLTHLNHLTISCQNLRKTTDYGFVEFLNILTKLQNLKSLELDFEFFRKLKNLGLAEIGNFAAKMQNLSAFRLALDGAKQISDRGFEKFQESLLTSKTIKFLKLRFNYTNISQASVKELENMFAPKKLLVALPLK